MSEPTDSGTPEPSANEEQPDPGATGGEPAADAAEGTEETHWLEKLYDNPWLLLLLGILIPGLSYTLWGLIELLAIPPAPAP